jgi:hypothetical protein
MYVLFFFVLFDEPILRKSITIEKSYIGPIRSKVNSPNRFQFKLPKLHIAEINFVVS